jgi:glycosyltransferase involved in cell wall biosynthesis
VPEKGIEMFLRAAAQLPDQRFLVAGQGPEQAALMKRYDLPNVRWLGQLAGVDLQNVLARARALIFPSQWYENFPLAILESFASGVPVIASRLGGVPELVQSGVNGQLFAPSDLTALVAAIKGI